MHTKRQRRNIISEQEDLPSEYFNVNLVLHIIFKRLNIIAIGKIIEHK